QPLPYYLTDAARGAPISEANRIATPRPKGWLERHQRQCSSPLNTPTLSTHPPRVNWPGRMPSDAMQQQSDKFNLGVNFCQTSFGTPPAVTSGADSPTPTIIATTSIYSSRDTSTTITAVISTATSGEGLELNCQHCDLTFTSHISLVGHLRIHRTETGEPVPGAPTYSRDHRLLCSHCPCAFTHRMGLFGCMRLHGSGIHRNSNGSDTPCTPSTPAIFTTSATPAPPDFSCQHCSCNFTSRIGLVSHLRIHRTEPGESVLGLRCNGSFLMWPYGTPTQLESEPTFSHVVVFLFSCVCLRPLPSPVFLTLSCRGVKVGQWN
ncbi:unnamed protein product, partial [Schistocephalus solidus]|uniref:C2H2-type domain-containing protein n=1 Tax=Schistocephalus solidus TaxID=70667 RepID=A0A183SFY9_SCHSO